MDKNKIIQLLPDIAAFVTIVESKTFSSAAKNLGVTPSGISRQLSRLEKELNVQLIKRSTRNQTITAAGLEVYQYGKNILHNAQEVINLSGQQAQRVDGQLTISAPKAFCRQVLQPMLLAFVDKYPKIKLKIQVTDKPIDPIYHDVDIVFTLTNNPQNNLVAKKLATNQMVLCATPHYLSAKGTPTHPQQLLSHDCIYLGETITDNQWRFKSNNEQVTVTVNGRYVANHTEMRLEAALQNLGIAVLPVFVAKKSLQSGILTSVLSDWNILDNYQGEVFMQYLPNLNMPYRQRIFLDFISEQFIHLSCMTIDTVN
ncbi:LysR family transcriptional regulator [Photobacterium kishitanii]|uniref:LysR family transcriptional regulator n=1 Tax=Photobacterium kishitanii TaxID=318456 RepID=UPI0005D3FAFA|nr:LysR family transcriptional regulator [Photobacterium kishitanii]KJG11393.1 LysR family transcriptional regulator [Photobacterium kishitanii]PSV05814.1 LysR family transcriptional regulator [Photobacterium kishitanii]PSV75700.1 LysR family transcriptional regulator [Photobacterium kishitanii]